MRDFAFIQTVPGRLFVGWGPFEQLPFRRPGRPAFFITDFFLDDPHPWRHPAAWEEIGADEFASRFDDVPPPQIEWRSPSFDDFAVLFESARAEMLRGEFRKIVPVLFEHGRMNGAKGGWHYFLRRLASAPPDMWVYGYSYQGHGMAGITPEMLFESDGRRYRTMALAGTRPAAESAELLRDPKELLEHRMVVDDIVRRLAPFGNIEIDPVVVREFPGIAHLSTTIRFEESTPEKMSFAEMVRRLHPTAALGVSPRTEAGERWLRQADRGVRRRTFGAPFGIEREDHHGLALVAIRNVQWSRDEVRVGSGAGLLLESRLEREFEELRQKREQVKALLGIDAAVPSVSA